MLRAAASAQPLEKCQDALHASRREAFQRAASIQSALLHSEAPPDYDIAAAETVSTPGYQSPELPTESTPGEAVSDIPVVIEISCSDYTQESQMLRHWQREHSLME
jgi:hypothetical protein